MGYFEFKLMNAAGHESSEAGSISWSDCHTAGSGCGRKDTNFFKFLYSHPVNFFQEVMSWSKCILVSNGGFDCEIIPKYYEDDDIWMHVQQELRKQI